MPAFPDPALALLPTSTDAPSLARAFVAPHTAPYATRIRDVVDLLVSELVTNASQYGEPPVVVRVGVAGAVLRVETHDRGPMFTVPVIRTAELGTPGGWGLAIVASLATSWGIVPTERPGGKWVWFEVDTTRAFPELPGVGMVS